MSDGFLAIPYCYQLVGYVSNLLTSCPISILRGIDELKLDYSFRQRLHTLIIATRSGAFKGAFVVIRRNDDFEFTTSFEHFFGKDLVSSLCERCHSNEFSFGAKVGAYRVAHHQFSGFRKSLMTGDSDF